jgi:hypothetical protein
MPVEDVQLVSTRDDLDNKYVGVITWLADLEDAPWSDLFGRSLTARRLAEVLRAYKTRHRAIRITDPGYNDADPAQASKSTERASGETTSKMLGSVTCLFVSQR